MWKWAAYFALWAAISGCYDVTSPQPVGESELKLTPEEWDGDWLTSDDELLILKVVDAEKGFLSGAWLGREETGPVLKRSPLYVREAAGWDFLSMSNESDGSAPATEYYWGRVKNDGDTLIVWLPDVPKFRTLVDDGTLPGRIESGNVKLGKLDSSHYQLITSEKRGLLFDWENPLVLRRLRK